MLFQGPFLGIVCLGRRWAPVGDSPDLRKRPHETSPESPRECMYERVGILAGGVVPHSKNDNKVPA